MTRAQSQKIIVSTEKKLWDAWKNKDTKVFKTYLSADSVMIGDAGVATKTEALKELEGMACEVKSYELSDIKVAFLNNDAALMTYKAVQDGTCNGQAVPPTVWASSAYVKRGGKWVRSEPSGDAGEVGNQKSLSADYADYSDLKTEQSSGDASSVLESA
jgi:hypothetical protein